MAMGRHGWMWISAAALAALSLAASAGRADEIRLKDGRKLYGVIVAYEDNMFKVKTDFGYVLVEKDKIASIIPDTPAEAAESKGGSKPSATRATGKSEIPGTSETKSATQTVPDNKNGGRHESARIEGGDASAQGSASRGSRGPASTGGRARF